MTIDHLFGVWHIQCARCGKASTPHIPPVSECTKTQAIKKVCWCPNPKCHSKLWNKVPTEAEREARRLRKEAKK